MEKHVKGDLDNSGKKPKKWAEKDSCKSGLMRQEEKPMQTRNVFMPLEILLPNAQAWLLKHPKVMSQVKAMSWAAGAPRT
jgi:hypothetical protein